MLSPSRDDDEDDNHLCIKCNATIAGLDNYIKHRRELCGKRKYDALQEMKSGASKTEMSTIDPLEPMYSLGADVFFQSLELQSSVKKTSLARLTPSVTSNKTSSNIDRKSNSIVVPSSSRHVPRMSPLESNLRGEDWIGGHTLRIVGNEDNQTRLIHAVDNISGVGKKDTPSTSYNISYSEFKDDESDDASSESEDDEEEDVHTSSGKWKPPLHHTGGKWRPVSPDNDEWDLRDEHTGGKWKPILTTDLQERDDDYDDAPPPSHTKGKWVPGANEQKTPILQNTIQSKGSVQYWCGACNRRLGSRAIYEKHLQSNLHIRKVLPENDLEFSGHMDRTEDLKEKRVTRPSHFVDDTLYSQMQRKSRSKVATDTMVNRKKRTRNPYFVHCSGCKSRVRLHLMGKHLISHYHFRKTSDIHSETYKQLILDNIEAIVHQSPFQCSPCKFYTNWLSNLMQHWFTEEHEQKMASIEGRYWCSFCKFECEGSAVMLEHMSSADHGEVVAVINRSMPIIIRKKTILKCNTCYKDFRYNIELKKHCEKTDHDLPDTATDFYQELHKCQLCMSKFKSSLSLAAHLKSKHKQKSFFCLICSLTFESSIEAKRHRYTSKHRINQKEKLRERGVPTKGLSRKCPYCIEIVILKNILELKDHIRKDHPNIKKKCPKCGMAFVLPQEVTRHVRNNTCTFQDLPDPDLLKSSVLWKCSQCLFQTDSQAECFFHEVLHTKPDVLAKIGGSQKVVEKYTCPLCPKSFRKASLRLHIRQHTFERPLVCEICSANFTRWSTLATHIKAEHGVGRTHSDGVLDKDSVTKNVGENSLHCESTATTHTKIDSSGQSPLDVTPTSSERAHTCPYFNCNYLAKTAAQLARHRRVHGERARSHQCPLCDFRSGQASHMKRHAICHQGIKPYGCPHCSFICASLENLRKHASRHVGLPLYRCPAPACARTSPLASDLRAHLVSVHPHLYTPHSAMLTVKTLLIRDQYK